jgi:hypothetical protein
MYTQVREINRYFPTELVLFAENTDYLWTVQQLTQLSCTFLRKIDMHGIRYRNLLPTAWCLLSCTCGF